MNIDVSVFVNGFHGDCSTMVAVGEVDASSQQLITTTYECLELGLALCRPGARFSEIGKVITKYAKKKGYSVSSDFCGHGIGRTFHEEPIVRHTPNNMRTQMQIGNTFTIEPILCEGGAEYAFWSDDWTVVSKDGGRSAQYEHTLLITPDGYEILTSSNSDYS